MQDFNMLLKLVIIGKSFATSVTSDFDNAHVIVSFVMEHQRFFSEIFITKATRVSDSRTMDKPKKEKQYFLKRIGFKSAYDYKTFLPSLKTQQATARRIFCVCSVLLIRKYTLILTCGD